jgi:hypothetical protein
MQLDLLGSVPEVYKSQARMPFRIWMQGIALQLWIRQDIGNRVLDQRDVLRFGQ